MPRPKSLAWLLVLMLVSTAFVAIFATTAHAQEVGATATKDCPPAPAGDPYTIGDTVTCTATFVNVSAAVGEITQLEEEQPWPGGTVSDIECSIDGGVTFLGVGDDMPGNTVCTSTFDVTIPNDVALCNTAFLDRVDVSFLYDQFEEPLISGAFATHVLIVVCPPSITVDKTADELGKITDPVDYTIEVCNTGLITVTKTSVIDTLIADVDAAFGATLAAGACESHDFSRVVVDTDPDPLVNTVTATYSAGIQVATATDSATTELFQPSVGVSKNCSPDPILVGEAELCTIVVANTSSGDSPGLENGTINDTLSGDLLAVGNTAVVNSDCTTTLAVGASCTINTSRVVLDTDVSPLVNTVTVHYNPVGFPNDITASATDSVIIETPPGGEGCTPGFWKQSQHFGFWTGFATTDLYDVVFGVDSTLGSGGKNDPILTNPTLLQAVSANGGGQNALARHAVAALLNSTNPDVDSVYTTAEVIALVQGAYASGDFTTAKNLLAAANELGCPIGGQNPLS